MADRKAYFKKAIALEDLLKYQSDSESSFRLFFSDSNPHYSALFLGESTKIIRDKLEERLLETDIRSTIMVLAKVEAAFRRDYLIRGQGRRPRRELISNDFRSMYGRVGDRARLKDDIFTVWKNHFPEFSSLLESLKGAFNFRHWVAHGRYWPHNSGNKYDFQTVYLLAQTTFTKVPLLDIV